VKDREVRNIPVHEVGHLNGLPAAEALRELNVDLGILIGTRVFETVDLFQLLEWAASMSTKGRFLNIEACHQVLGTL